MPSAVGQTRVEPMGVSVGSGEQKLVGIGGPWENNLGEVRAKVLMNVHKCPAYQVPSTTTRRRRMGGRPGSRCPR